MDKQSHILECAEKYVPYSSEPFLVTLANKGLYNRAVKDMPSVALWSEETDGEKLIVKLDDITVILDPNVSKSVCSCPSMAVCKHIVMALLHASELCAVSPKENAAAPAASENCYCELKNIDLEFLRKKAGKKIYENALTAISDGVSAKFSEGDTLCAVISDDGAAVHFPPWGSIEGAVCKCGAAGFCRHKTIAVLCWLKNNAGLAPEVTGKVVPAVLNDDDMTLINFAGSVVSGILKKGASMCGENDIDACSQLATRLASDDIGNIAKLFRSLASHIENMMGKKAAFSRISMTDTVCRLYNTIAAVKRNAGDNDVLSKLVEGGRSRYYSRGSASFAGLGAYPWETASGFSGVTAYLYNFDEKLFYTYTLSHAGYYENTASFSSLKNLIGYYESRSNWENSISVKDISRGLVKLKNFKSDKSRRISSAKSTVASTEAETKPALLQESGIVAGDYDEIFKKASGCRYDYFSGEHGYFPCLLPFERIEGREFDKTEQTLYFQIINKSGRRLVGRIVYSEINSLAFKYLMDAGKKDRGLMFARISRARGNGVAITPLSLIDETGVKNIYFEDKR